MIQRVQTLFLFFIAVSMGVALSFPIWEKVGPISTEMAHLSALEYTHQQGVTTYVDKVWYLALLIALVGLVSLYAIFQYRNRLTQTALCAVNALMLTAVMGIVLYRTLYIGKEYGNPGEQGNFLTGFYAIIAALVFNMLANRFIRRDEKLVRDSNRLR
ncbi:DUF4293 domain-containing protein [Spirosoma sp. BT702]|uniref:DUF4293 domain-containing protein n=1 Tax=Spirosoma profusum TaxID=2771354 RepID=A0A926XZA8_9BACT|nr:DUF4293 domain-containing protein [Spirosoma profusum]MBD2700967.1 DUF4293 domain-containing protein [Spirosoma profusum]